MNIEEVISSLGNNAYVSQSEMRNIYNQLIKLPDRGRMLELGTGMSHSTTLFSHSRPDWIIYTVDAYGTAGSGPHLYSREKMGEGVQEVFWHIKGACLKNVIQIISGFTDLPWELEVNALFIDGSHWYEDVKEDWDKFSPFVVKGGLVIFHDYTPTYSVIEFIEKEVKTNKDWEFWNEEGIGFAKRL